MAKFMRTQYEYPPSSNEINNITYKKKKYIKNKNMSKMCAQYRSSLLKSF